ncbi:LexA family protein [Sphingomonas solaris]|nr:S24 family peptidase [Sphingomonas solaris]
MTPEQLRDALKAKFGSVRAAAIALGIDENHLTKHWGKARRQLSVKEMDAVRSAIIDESIDEARPVRSIPWLGSVPASDFRAAEEFGGRRFLVSDPETPAGAYALTVRGDSMDLIVPDGASIVIDPDDTALWPGKRYVIMTADGDKTFKEFQADPARLIPCSSNSAHREIALGSEPIKILGRVFSYTTRDAPRRKP